MVDLVGRFRWWVRGGVLRWYSGGVVGEVGRGRRYWELGCGAGEIGERGADVLLEARFLMGFGGGMGWESLVTGQAECSQEGIRGFGNFHCWVRGSGRVDLLVDTQDFRFRL